MEERTVIVNGKTLTDREASSLRLALDLATLDLEHLPREQVLDGLTIPEHLANLREIEKLVRTA